MARLPICEYLDPDGARLSFSVRQPGLDARPLQVVHARLVSRRGRVRAETSAEIVVRTNTVGRRTRSRATLTFDVRDLSPGSYRLEVRFADGFTQVDPSTGLLASSRRLDGAGRMVQVFPGVESSTWIRLGVPTRMGRGMWAMTNIARDFLFALRMRRFTWIRPARFLTRPLVPKGPIWLVGERAETARDNGWAFFTHARSSNPDAPIYYVMNQDAAERAGVTDTNIVNHSSIRHRLLLLHAETLINAYSIKHMLPESWHPGAYMKQAAWRIGAKRVYLKHGVHMSPDAVKRSNSGYDLVCTVGAREADALADGSGYSSQLRVTGLARYDNLTAPPVQGQRSILFMPTWRRYLVPTLFSSDDVADIEFEGSTYERFITGILTSPKLETMLERYDLRFDFVPHHNLSTITTGWPVGGHVLSPRITVHDPRTADIPGFIRHSVLLCTDYSSVHFDSAYLGRPVVYVQVDREEFLSTHTALSWFQFDPDGFGPVVTSVEDAIERMARYAQHGFVRESEYEDRVRAIFRYRDRRNSERILDEISRLP